MLVPTIRYRAGLVRLVTEAFLGAADLATAAFRGEALRGARAAAFFAGSGAGATGCGLAIPVLTASVPRAEPIAVAARCRRSVWPASAGGLWLFFRVGIARV